MRCEDTDKEDGTPLLAVLETSPSPLPVCGDGKTDGHRQ